jgi:hypothetical protein
VSDPFRKSVSDAAHHEIAQHDERLVKAAIDAVSSTVRECRGVGAV